jgi:hypothetical protein
MGMIVQYNRQSKLRFEETPSNIPRDLLLKEPRIREVICAHCTEATMQDSVL